MVENALILQPYFTDDYAQMLELSKARHQAYADKWGFDLLHLDLRKALFRVELETVQAEEVALVGKLLSDYSFIVWTGVDSLIWDMDTDLRTATDRIGAVRFNAHLRIPSENLYKRYFGGKHNHFNLGTTYMKRCPFTLDFVREWSELSHEIGGWYGAQNAFNILAIEHDLPALDKRWNYNRNRHKGCPDPVIIGYHGYRGVDLKIKKMSQDIGRLNDNEHK